MTKALKIAVENYEEHMRERNIPACFPNEEEYNAWVYMESITVPTQPIRKFVCRDCTTEYQLRMKKENRCFNTHLIMEKFAD